ncbi:MAG: isoprenylcysteine carboxylmethyltransferase family protein, partial [Chthoniobacter sp.]
RYVLPWIYVWFIYKQIRTAHAGYVDYHLAVRFGLPHESWPLFCASITRIVLLTVLLLFTGLTLLLNRRPKHLPTKLVHITVPLAMSYYVFLYGMLDKLPEDLRENLLPAAWQVPAAAAAVIISMIGYAISFWGICNLGRSFAVLVAVRNVVTAGPYAYVRHPMYLGYLIELFGLVIASFSLGMFLLAAGYIFLMVVRAQLEEDRLAEADPGYREYMQRTGFLFPRFGTKRAAN